MTECGYVLATEDHVDRMGPDQVCDPTSWGDELRPRPADA